MRGESTPRPLLERAPIRPITQHMNRGSLKASTQNDAIIRRDSTSLEMATSVGGASSTNSGQGQLNVPIAPIPFGSAPVRIGRPNRLPPSINGNQRVSKNQHGGQSQMRSKNGLLAGHSKSSATKNSFVKRDSIALEISDGAKSGSISSKEIQPTLKTKAMSNQQWTKSKAPPTHPQGPILMARGDRMLQAPTRRPIQQPSSISNGKPMSKVPYKPDHSTHGDPGANQRVDQLE